LSVISQNVLSRDGKTSSLWQTDRIHLMTALLAPDPTRSFLPDDQNPIGLDGHFDSLWRPDRFHESLYPALKS
jgi:hypothetical protein